MKNYVKEILFGSLVVICLIVGITHFYRNIQEQRQTERIDLHSLIASDLEGLIRINRPQVASSLIFSQTEMKGIIDSSIPEIYLSLARNCPAVSILSIHPQGIVFYAKADDKVVRQIREKVLDVHFPSYSPQEKEAAGVVFHLYPDTANRFFSYYHLNGVLVATHNSRLLEEVAVKQRQNNNNSYSSLSPHTDSFDLNAPVNLLLPAGKLNLHIPVNDSLQWYSPQEWLTADLFSNEGKTCCYGRLEVPFSLDSLYLSLAADTLSSQLEKSFPRLKIDSQIYQEGDVLYYTGCF